MTRRRWRGAARSREHGSAIAEFVMVSGLLLFVTMAVFQLALVLYIRNTLVASASEGARLGARADAEPGDAAARTTSLVSRALNSDYATNVKATEHTTSAGVRVVEVTVVAPLPLLGPIGPSGAMTVSGRAFSEDQVIADATGTTP